MNVKFIRIFLQAAQIRGSLRFGAEGYLDLASRKQLLLYFFFSLRFLQAARQKLIVPAAGHFAWCLALNETPVNLLKVKLRLNALCNNVGTCMKLKSLRKEFRGITGP